MICPPWSIQASKILHDNKKLYTYNVLRKFMYTDIYFPKLSHPDPTVKRRSGFLVPVYQTQNLGSAISIPYFFDIDNDKNFTLKSRLC